MPGIWSCSVYWREVAPDVSLCAVSGGWVELVVVSSCLVEESRAASSFFLSVAALSSLRSRSVIHARRRAPSVCSFASSLPVRSNACFSRCVTLQYSSRCFQASSVAAAAVALVRSSACWATVLRLSICLVNSCERASSSVHCCAYDSFASCSCASLVVCVVSLSWASVQYLPAACLSCSRSLERDTVYCKNAIGFD